MNDTIYKYSSIIKIKFQNTFICICKYYTKPHSGKINVNKTLDYTNKLTNIKRSETINFVRVSSCTN